VTAGEYANMKKKSGWQLTIIITVIGLTLYNILPTVLYYAKPLKAPINEKQAESISTSIMTRVNHLEKETRDWLVSFNDLIQVKSSKIRFLEKSPQIIEIAFENQKDADRFKKMLPRAGSLIPFYPAQLSLYQNRAPTETLSEGHKENSIVYVHRNIPLKFSEMEPKKHFTYSKMYRNDGKLTKNYETVLNDRIFQLAYAIGGPSENSGLTDLVIKQTGDPRAQDFAYNIAQSILTIDKIFQKTPALAQKLYSTFTQGTFENQDRAVKELTEALASAKDQAQMKKIALKEKEYSLSPAEQSELNALIAKEENFLKALAILKKDPKAFASGPAPLDAVSIYDLIDKMDAKSDSQASERRLEIGDQNPLIDAIVFNLSDETLSIQIKKEILSLKKTLATIDKKEALNQLIFNEIAKISRNTNEQLLPSHDEYVISLKDLSNSNSYLSFNLSQVAKSQLDFVNSLLTEQWQPVSQDLERDAYPISNWSDFQKMSASQKHLQLVLYAPILDDQIPQTGFKENSIYIIAKDLGKIAQKFGKDSQSKEAAAFNQDFQNLATLMQNNGFIGYPGTTYPLPAAYANDFIFEASDYYLPLLQATRENFKVHGTKREAILELSDLSQRIHTENRIETQIHEDLIKWKDEYNTAQVDPTMHSKFDIPKPTKNIYLSNFFLSLNKYFRGDDRKVLQWGLDLSGGKTVQLALKDSNNQLVTNEADIKQGINELYNRVNKMGVSDVSIRQEGNSITLDFPSSQDMSASDLVKASSMTFNMVNEKFAVQNGTFSQEVNQFLSEVWNEAVVTNKQDLDNISQIAYAHLYGEGLGMETAEPRNDSARILYQNGFRLMNPNNPEVTNNFDDSTSRIAIYRGNNYSDWHGQTHPLLITFKNFVIEGSNLTNVHGGYDPSKGNYLSFDVRGSQTTHSGQKLTPRKDMYTWTSLFSKEQISGTPYEAYTKGNGWRMAVILNGYVVSSPHLESPLKDSGMISGHFSQREINHLVADLKAGSLSFTPQILSEKSVSPELGLKERVQGITAAGVALLAVVLLMVGYYRFAGMIASIAVLFNILIIWAALQNIGATITLAGIAGVILTIGMAVDANVLVFERIREEFEKTKKISTAIQSGYKKAFSAILDSNVTTIIAALILLNFDSGPIKGLAITLSIGIISSMFTALFMTKYFFLRWAQNPKHTKLTMANVIQSKNINFLSYGKLSMIISLLLIVGGGYALYKNQHTIFGMDFVGGYSVNVEVEKTKEGDYRKSVENALQKAGLTPQEIQVRELYPTNQLRIFLSKSLDHDGKAFQNMPFATQLDNPTYVYETNPRLVWLVNVFKDAKIELSASSLVKLDQDWKSVSGQMSDTMRQQAIIGLVLALACILLYVAFRFEFTFAISATIGLAFDIGITVGILSLLHLLSVPVQIDLNTIAALMTIIGYSLNDTIIVFDRIREDMKLMRRSSFSEIINHALNITLSRTILTSATTLLVLISLVVLGGSSIFGFSLIMAIGVVVGTLSTFFIATTLLLFLQKKKETNGDDHLSLNGHRA